MSEHHEEGSDIERGLVNLEYWLEIAGIRSEVLMDVLELLTALIMIVLFAIGVYDLGYQVVGLLVSGQFTDPNEVLDVIDTALLLLIIVEIYRTVIAYVEDLNILPIVVNVALIAMARKIISFRTGKYATKGDAVQAAIAYGLLMAILVGAFYLIHQVQEQTEFNIYAAGEDDDENVSG